MVPSCLLHNLKHNKCKIGKFPDKFLELSTMWLFVSYPLCVSKDAMSARSLTILCGLCQNSAKWLVYQMVPGSCLCLFKCFSNNKKKSNIPYFFWALYNRLGRFSPWTIIVYGRKSSKFVKRAPNDSLEQLKTWFQDYTAVLYSIIISIIFNFFSNLQTRHQKSNWRIVFLSHFFHLISLKNIRMGEKRKMEIEIV